MLVDHACETVAFRSEAGVRVQSLPRGSIAEITPPDGHQVVAVSVERPLGHITSDGRSLYEWRDQTGPVDLSEVVATKCRPHDRERSLACIRETAALPTGPLGHACFLRVQQTGAEPRWPTVLFVCAGRLVVAQLDYFGRFDRKDHDSYRAVLTTPEPEHDPWTIAAWSVLTHHASGSFAAQAILCESGRFFLSEPRSVCEAFDHAIEGGAYPLDAPRGAHRAVMHALEQVEWTALEGESELVVQRPGLYGDASLAYRVERASEEHLVGVTARGELIVQVEDRLGLRTRDRSEVLATGIAEAASGRCGVAWRDTNGEIGHRLL